MPDQTAVKPAQLVPAKSDKPTIHEAILGVMMDIGRIGIAKSSKNREQNYDFRGIEQAMNMMAPIIRDRGITIEPNYSDLQIGEKATKSGGSMRLVTIKGTFKFTGPAGDSITSSYYGEGMDSGDKAVTKAQSVAFRTALFQQFIVPTMAIDPETGEVILTRAEELEEIAQSMVQAFNDGKEVKAYETWLGVTDNEEKLKVWGHLRSHSTLRSAIKKMAEADKKTDKAPE